MKATAEGARVVVIPCRSVKYCSQRAWVGRSGKLVRREPDHVLVEFAPNELRWLPKFHVEVL